jgi:hypothetical protein
MINLQMKGTKGRTLRRVKANIQRFPDRLRNALRGPLGRAANVALKQLTRIPGPPRYPLRWSSDRQRRAFFATDGFGGGIPTRRSDSIVNEWRALFQQTKDGGTLIIENDHPAATFLQGSNQQPFHKDTGWVRVDDVSEDFLKLAGDVTADVFYKEAAEL